MLLTSDKDIDHINSFNRNVPCMICRSFSCSICFQRFGFIPPDPQTASSPHIRKKYWQNEWFVVFNLCRKAGGKSLLLHRTAGLVMAECVWSLVPLMMFHPRFCVDPKYLKWFRCGISPFIHPSYWQLVFAWYCWRGFSLCRNWFPCRIRQLPSISLSCCSSSSLSPRISMPSANRMLHSGRLPIAVEVSLYFPGIYITTVVRKNIQHFHLVSPRWSFHCTYNDLMTSISRLSMLYSFKTSQRPSC